MRRERILAVAAGAQIVLFQILLWALLAGHRARAIWLTGAALAMAGLALLIYGWPPRSTAGR